MAERTGDSEPLSGATTTQGAKKKPSPTPAALSGRLKGGKSRIVDE
jgi:hypothetical protein